MQPSQRRKLAFHNLNDVVADVEQLQRGGYRRLGQWSLGQICKHLGIFVQGSLDGFTQKVPWFIRLFGGFILRRMLKQRAMPVGVKVPASFLPPPEVDETPEVAAFCELLRRFDAHRGPLQPSPLFGAMSKETWLDLHLIHAAHHLSFLVPERVGGPA